jgi:hypothetical protein
MTLRTKIALGNLFDSACGLLGMLRDLPKIVSEPGGFPFEPTSFWRKAANTLFFLFLWAAFLVTVALMIPMMIFVWASGKLLGLAFREEVMIHSLLECVNFAVSGEFLDTRHERL